MGKLYVVRHTRVEIDQSLHPSLWSVSLEGIMLMQPIAECSVWQEVGMLYSSPEPKAMATAQIITRRWGMRICRDGALRELEMQEGHLERDKFLRIVGDHLEGVRSHPSLEPYDRAQERIVSAVARIAARHKGESVGVISHGRILTALYGYLLGRRLSREEWQSIRMPDISVINTETWKVEAGFLAPERR